MALSLSNSRREIAQFQSKGMPRRRGLFVECGDVRGVHRGSRVAVKGKKRGEGSE
jgi:hypothetical protein